MAEDYKQIIRVCNSDLKGNLLLCHGLTKIKGISYSFANALCNTLDLDKNRKIGTLDITEIQKIEETVKSPSNLPSWLLNRRKDRETGTNKHLLTSSLKLQKEFDVKYLMRIKSYRGMRHSFGLPVRGQRTRAHFRKGASLGVQREAAKMAKASSKEKK